MSEQDPTRDAVVDAIGRGFQPIAIQTHLKKPLFGGWQNVTWPEGTTFEDWEARIKTEWGFDPALPYNIGIVLGPVSGNLVDVDIDHPKAKRFRNLLPRTHARSGRPGSPDSHYWYIVEEGTTGNPTIDAIPSTRRYTLPTITDASGVSVPGDVTVEFRYNRGVQTVIPPSDWVPKDWEALGSPKQLIETRSWTRDPWGGTSGPARVNGRQLAMQVALVALCTTLIDRWPTAGSRHEAYLALSGALLRLGDGLVHPFWEQHARIVIRNIASATNDDDGPDARESESIESTLRGLRGGKFVWGFPKLAEILGDEQVAAIRILVAEIEQLAGYVSRQASALPAATAASPASGAPAAGTAPASPATSSTGAGEPATGQAETAAEELHGSWAAIDLDPYLNGQLPQVEPTVLVRDDGKALFYPGRLNMLFAPSESGKTLVALWTSLERMNAGERVLFIDFEDEPVNTIERLRSMGASDDDLRLQFTYVRPDEPIASMQRDHWGSHKATPAGERNAQLFHALLENVDPTLIIADGMTSIYGLHGLDSNNSVETDVITTWLKSLARNGRTTVIIIDHMAKSGDRGSMPIGSQHKVSMVQGALLQVWPKRQPVLGSIGELELIVLKDRPGQVRRYAGRITGRAQVAAIVTIDSSTNDGKTTLVTIAAPPNAGQPNAPAPTQTAASGASLQLDLAAGAAFVKLERQQAQDELFLSAFGNESGKTLSGKEITTAIGKDWLGNKWSNTALMVTRDRLITNGYILKSGGDRGPKVAYTLQVAIAADDDDDDGD